MDWIDIQCKLLVWTIVVAQSLWSRWNQIIVFSWKLARESRRQYLVLAICGKNSLNDKTTLGTGLHKQLFLDIFVAAAGVHLFYQLHHKYSAELAIYNRSEYEHVYVRTSINKMEYSSGVRRKRWRDSRGEFASAKWRYPRVFQQRKLFIYLFESESVPVFCQADDVFFSHQFGNVGKYLNVQKFCAKMSSFLWKYYSLDFGLPPLIEILRTTL